MASVVLPPDSEELFRAELAARLPQVLGGPVPVSTKVPDPRPDEFVIVRRVGGTMRDLVTDVPYILVEAWANTETRAVQIARYCQGFMHWFTEISGHSILGCDEISGPVNLPDGLSAQVRYTATYAPAVRSRDQFTPA